MENQLKFLLYKSDHDDITANVIVQDETIWISQKEMAKLFEVTQANINQHLKSIYETQELKEQSTIKNFLIVQKEGNREVRRTITHYNLDAIISVGYRVNSQKATRFRQWATQTLKEYMIKGFVLDDNRLKQGEQFFEQDYFKELLERIRSIRASERRVWLKITDIFAEISIDYDKNSQVTKQFYAMVQNKFHYAITGKTAAEIIYDTADHTKENMGLTTWKSAPDGRILKMDTQVAKNYLKENEIKQLERNVSAYMDYIEDLVERRNTFTMAEFAKSIDNFLNFREYKILDGYGKISMKTAKEKASQEYDIFNKTQKITSDFEKQAKRLDK